MTTKTTRALKSGKRLPPSADIRMDCCDKTTSALEQLRGYNSGAQDPDVAPIIAAFEDEQRQRDERDAKIREQLLSIRNCGCVEGQACVRSLGESLALLDT